MKFEHRYAEADNHKLLVAVANELGADGWQLVSTMPVAGVLVGFFKRQVQPQ